MRRFIALVLCLACSEECETPVPDTTPHGSTVTRLDIRGAVVFRVGDSDIVWIHE